MGWRQSLALVNLYSSRQGICFAWSAARINAVALVHEVASSIPSCRISACIVPPSRRRVGSPNDGRNARMRCAHCGLPRCGLACESRAQRAPAAAAIDSEFRAMCMRVTRAHHCVHTVAHLARGLIAAHVRAHLALVTALCSRLAAGRCHARCPREAMAAPRLAVSVSPRYTAMFCFGHSCELRTPMFLPLRRCPLQGLVSVLTVTAAWAKRCLPRLAAI